MIEFVLISVLLIFLLFGVLQVAALFYVRSVTAAAAADGARYAANADVDAPAGGRRAHDLIGRGLGRGLAADLPCSGRDGRDGRLRVAEVRCTGRIRSLLLPIGAFVTVDVSARSLEDPP